MKRVAVTGVGVVSPLGQQIDEAFEAARQGRSAVRAIEAPFVHRLAAPIAASVAGFNGAAHFPPPQLRMLDRASQFALVAMRQAVTQAGEALSGLRPERGGVFIGTGMGGTLSNDEGYQTLYGENSDRIKPYTVLLGMHNAAAAWIAIELGLQGPSLTHSSACSSSSVAIGEAWRRVAQGELDLVLAGGTEAPLSLGSLKAWEALRTLASPDPEDVARSCKPFSKNRSGMVLGEGAALLALEHWDRAVARGATIHGEVIGVGLATDTGHITRPSVEGQAQAMQAALNSAGIAASEVDGINAHGTGTVANDRAEAAAIRAVFGARAGQIPVSATKAVHGHLLGAGGALELVLSLWAMKHAVALPTAHLAEPDPACDLDLVPHTAREGVAMRTMLSNSFAFGGSNAVLAFRGAP